MAHQPDDEFTRLQRGASAGYVRADLAQRLAIRESKLMSAVIAKWRAGQLTGDDARATIAAIAELRGILDDLEREARQGQDARQRVMQEAPGP